MLEKMYQDFVEKFLPTIQQGLTITKEYFFDLFGRYVQYLIIVDTMLLVASVFGFFILGYGLYKAAKNVSKLEEAIIPIAMFGIFIEIIFVVCIFNNTNNLVKDRFIPEVRVYEELKDFNK